MTLLSLPYLSIRSLVQARGISAPPSRTRTTITNALPHPTSFLPAPRRCLLRSHIRGPNHASNLWERDLASFIFDIRVPRTYDDGKSLGGTGRNDYLPIGLTTGLPTRILAGVPTCIISDALVRTRTRSDETRRQPQRSV